MHTALGIDVGGSSVKVAAIGGRDVLWVAQSEAYERPERQKLAGAIRGAISGRFNGSGAVGICVPGVRTGRIVSHSINLPALNGLLLDDLVGDALGRAAAHLEITTDSIANAYDIYIAHKLKGRLLAMALGTGVGAAVIDEGCVPLMVEGESSGHIGQIDVSLEGEPVIGPDGGAGSLEGYFGAGVLQKRYGKEISEILPRLGKDDPGLRALGRAIRICHAIYRPHHVALTGGLGIRFEHLLPVIRELVDTKLTNVARPDWTLFIGDDDFHAARGAARIAMDRTK